MDIKILDLEDSFIRFAISGVDISFVNSIRRALLADVPKMAIEEVEIHLGAISDEEGKTYESTTPLFDEIIAHRLGLIPIPTELDQLNFKEECDCGGEGCPGCSIMYSLNKRGPCTVYSGDLEPLGDDSLRIKDAHIPIVKLTEDEGILIYATAILGTGKQHAKWQATQAAGYKLYPTVEIDTKKCDHGGACISICPVNIIVKEGKKVKATDIGKCTMCNSCVEICELDAIKIGHEDNKFIFRFETDGALLAKEALIYATAHVAAAFEEVTELLDVMKPKEYKPIKAVKKVFEDEDPEALPEAEATEEEAPEEEPVEEVVEEVVEEKPKKKATKKAAKKTTKKAAKKK
ncbi:MAG: DNA-directed RNA polymerase subunit D [Thermoplasmata archaeon]|nr:DNA-directed RNA polymerase subunit D [Thermoplasmata archaeon]